MSLIDHAKTELMLSGQMEEDPAFATAIIAAVGAFSAYGHSGGSIGPGIHMLTELLQFRALTPLTDDPNEWHDHGEMSGTPLWQNKRQSSAFSYDGGRTYYTLEDRDRLGSMEFVPFYDSVHVEPAPEAVDPEPPCVLE